jgi:hypothetical protein
MILAVVLLAGAAAAGCRTPDRASESEDWFVDRAIDVGLDFVHVNGMSGGFYFPEVMPPGVALFDYDNDGDLDAYLVQGTTLAGSQSSAAPTSRLFRNDLRTGADRRRTLRFTDVTPQSRIDAAGYGMGVAAGDIDNDGWTDLYLTYFGTNRMLRNNGDGTFTDVSRQSGTDASGFFVSSAFLDYDRDGWLDLYVAGYVTYSVASDQPCTDLAGVRGYCPPQVYPPSPDRLYRNQGNATFVDVTDRALLGGESGRGLGVVTADFNDDGWLDIYVANDGGENVLWTNLGNGTFRNDALRAGVALTADGHAEASMGVDAGDFDNDGDEDLVMTELNGEGSNLYVNSAPGLFDDRSAQSGLGMASRQHTGFGTAWLDFDNDGWLDLLSVNGRVQAAEGAGSDAFPMHQRKLLFRNLQDGRFEEMGARAGTAFQSLDVGRGAAFGDIDNDGDQDVLVGNDAGRPQLLLNNVGSEHHWIGLRLIGMRERRDMIGASVTVIRNQGPALRRRARSDGSYASANDPRVLVGLGGDGAAPALRIRWPSGRVEHWPRLAADRWHTLTEGDGQ